MPPVGASLMLALEFVDVVLRDTEAPRSGAVHYIGRPAPGAAYFMLLLGPHTERLLMTGCAV